MFFLFSMENQQKYVIVRNLKYLKVDGQEFRRWPEFFGKRVKVSTIVRPSICFGIFFKRLKSKLKASVQAIAFKKPCDFVPQENLPQHYYISSRWLTKRSLRNAATFLARWQSRNDLLVGSFVSLSAGFRALASFFGSLQNKN